MPQFRQYDPLDIKMSWNGIIFTGFAEGTFITVERNEDAFNMQVGSGGDVVRVKSNNRSGLATLTLMQSSPTNDLLSTKSVLDERLGVAGQVGPLSIVDFNGTTKIFALNTWIQKPAQVEFSNTASQREWMFACASIDMFIGGHVL